MSHKIISRNLQFTRKTYSKNRRTEFHYHLEPIGMNQPQNERTRTMRKRIER